MTDEKESYDSLDAFCAEYGFDAATTQRMRDDMLATSPGARPDERTFDGAIDPVKPFDKTGLIRSRQC